MSRTAPRRLLIGLVTAAALTVELPRRHVCCKCVDALCVRQEERHGASVQQETEMQERRNETHLGERRAGREKRRQRRQWCERGSRSGRSHGRQRRRRRLLLRPDERPLPDEHAHQTLGPGKDAPGGLIPDQRERGDRRVRRIGRLGSPGGMPTDRLDGAEIFDQMGGSVPERVGPVHRRRRAHAAARSHGGGAGNDQREVPADSRNRNRAGSGGAQRNAVSRPGCLNQLIPGGGSVATCGAPHPDASGDQPA